MASKIPRPVPKPAEKPKTDYEKLTNLISYEATGARSKHRNEVKSNIKEYEKVKRQPTELPESRKHIKNITDIKCSTDTGMVSRSKKSKSLPMKTSALPINNEDKTSKGIKAKTTVPESLVEKKEPSTVRQKFKDPANSNGAENLRKTFADKKINFTKLTNIVNTEKPAIDKSSLPPRRNAALHSGIKFIPKIKRKTSMLEFNTKSKESQKTSDEKDVKTKD